MTGLEQTGRLEELAAVCLPALAEGRTAERWLTMADWARQGSVGQARLAEAHHDACAILAEAGLTPRPGLYGVWASQSADEVVIDLDSMTLSGTKQFCSGAGRASRALVTATDPTGHQWLVETTAVPGERVAVDLTGWRTPALSDTATGTVTFDRHVAERTVGSPGWYLARPGFWHGAIGPAACWAGAALGLIDACRALATDDAHHVIALGELTAEDHLLRALLRDAGRSADDHPDDGELARRCAYSVRHLVERSATRIADTFSRAFGPRPFVTDASIAQRHADLHLYLRQQHGLRDLEALGAVERS